VLKFAGPYSHVPFGMDICFLDTKRNVVAVHRTGFRPATQPNRLRCLGVTRALATSAGVLFAPGLLVDGRPFGYGRLSERRLRRALGRMREETGTDREVTRG
jgi:hypothetical protein